MQAAAAASAVSSSFGAYFATGTCPLQRERHTQTTHILACIKYMYILFMRLFICMRMLCCC